MNPSSWLFTAEGLFRLCEIVAILAGVLAVTALIGKDIAGRVVAERKAKEMLALQKSVTDAQRDVAEARTKQAEAERRLELIRHRQNPRGLSDEFREAIKNKPTGEAVMAYVGGSSEVIMFTEALYGVLIDAGWQIPPPTQISSVLEVMPKGRSSAEVVIVCDLPTGGEPPRHAQGLLDALIKERFTVSMNAGIGYDLPDERPRIIVNPRQ